MRVEEKLVNTIKRIVRGMTYDYGVQIGVMTSDRTLSVHGMDIKSTELLFLEPSTLNIATKVAIEGDVGYSGGSEESPLHTHPFTYTDKSDYTPKLKAGDKVLLLRHNNQFVCLGRMVTL